MSEDKKLSEEIKINREPFENINSPQIIQDILRLSTESSQIEMELQNNTIKSLLSINENLLPILDNDFNDDDNFNPFILSQKKRKDLYRLNFEQINFTNNFLKEKLELYNELKQKINEYNKNKDDNKNEINYDKLNLENLEKNKKNEKDIENQKKEEMNKKLFLIKHPFISLFEEKININELKNEIKNEYLNKMKDNTNYKYLPPQINNLLNLPPQNNNLLNLPLLLNDENIVDDEYDNDDDNDDDNEDNEENEVVVEEDSENEEDNDQPEPILPPLIHIQGPVLPIAYANQGNLNNSNNDNNNDNGNDNGNNNDNNNDNNNENNNNNNDNNENIAG